MDVEKMIFEMYKNEIVIARKFKAEIMKMFNISLRTASDIFARIQNYQIKKFGRRLTYDNEVMTSEEKKYISLIARTRKQGKKCKYYENKEKY